MKTTKSRKHTNPKRERGLRWLGFTVPALAYASGWCFRARSKVLYRGATLLAVVLFASLPHAARADSIWDRREQRSAFLFVDSRARRVGDVLTVVVREATDIDNKEKRALNKSSQ